MANCWDIHGTLLSTDGVYPFTACNFTTSDGFVPCCQAAFSQCLANGACSYPAGQNQIIRGGCTDPSFKSPHCPRFMLDEPTNPNQPCAVSGLGCNWVHLCPNNGTGCYNYNAQQSSDNCSCGADNPNRLVIGQTTIQYATDIVSSTSSSSSSTTSSKTTLSTVSNQGAASTGSLSASIFSSISSSAGAAASSATSTAQAAASSGPNLGVAVGVPVGIVGGLAILGVAGFLLWRKKKSNAGHNQMSSIENRPGLYVGK